MTVDILAEIDATGCSESSVDHLATQCAAMLKAAGDALRLQILSVLTSDSFGVLELCQIFNIKQSGMSHHLKVLARADIVSTRREGNTKFYRRSDASINPVLSRLRDGVYKSAESLTLGIDVKTKLAEVYGQRAEASREFFRNNSAAFKKQQELIADFEVYGPEVNRLLEASPLPSTCRALEIGPGVGEFLNQLSRKFEQVTALDNSELMLKQSQQLCDKLELNNIEFICSDTKACRAQKQHFDCAVLNMVLHHTPSPQQIFQDVAESIKSKGVLLVSELGAHDQDWVRDACGDQWLGFTVEDLEAWARKARLEKAESRYLSLRNGFQIQIHQFIKQ